MDSGYSYASGGNTFKRRTEKEVFISVAEAKELINKIPDIDEKVRLALFEKLDGVVIKINSNLTLVDI